MNFERGPQLNKAWQSKAFLPSSGVLQRKCACGRHSFDSECVYCKESKNTTSVFNAVESGNTLEQTESITPEDLSKEHGVVIETVETNTDEAEESVGQERLLENKELPILRKTTRHAGSDNLVSKYSRPTNETGHSINVSSRKQYEQHFGRDLSSVRVHDGTSANQYTEKLSAVAATVGNHIYVNSNLENHNRQWLLAHELTHVVQQSNVPLLKNRQTEGRMIPSRHNLESEADRAADAFLTGKPVSITGRASRQPQRYQSTICRGRDNEHASTQQRDFPATYIRTVNVSLDTLRITLDWAGPSAAAAARDTNTRTGGFIRFSPGAGVRGQPSCNNIRHSKQGDSCCTPIGTFTAGGQACVTPKLGLQNFTNFQRDGIGLHYYHSVPRVPASHGCIRLFRAASEVLFDNIRPNVTRIAVSGRATGHRRHASCS